MFVLRPMVEGRRYDLMFDIDGRLLRVQCKWAPRRGNVIVVNLPTSRHTRGGYVRTWYRADEIDGVAVYCHELKRCFYLPIEVVAGRSGMHLRLSPAANNQEAAVNYADHYDLGAIAQLGERLRGTQEVAGSSPASSTSNVRPLFA
jgi:PD-(D/E)XK endonuclease